MTERQKKEMVMSAIIAYKTGSFINASVAYDSVKAEGYLSGILDAFELKKTVDDVDLVVINDINTNGEFIRWERMK